MLLYLLIKLPFLICFPAPTLLSSHNHKLHWLDGGRMHGEEVWYLSHLTVFIFSIQSAKQSHTQSHRQAHCRNKFCSRSVIKVGWMIACSPAGQKSPTFFASCSSAPNICCSHVHPPHVKFLAWQKTWNCGTDGRLYKPSLQQLMRLESRSHEPCLPFFSALLCEMSSHYLHLYNPHFQSSVSLKNPLFLALTIHFLSFPLSWIANGSEKWDMQWEILYVQTTFLSYPQRAELACNVYYLTIHSTYWTIATQIKWHVMMFQKWAFVPPLQQNMPWGSELRSILYTPVCLCREHHASLFLSNGDLQCQLLRLLISGRAERSFVSASLPAGTQKASRGFLERERASRRRGKRKSDLCSNWRVDGWARERRD